MIYGDRPMLIGGALTFGDNPEWITSLNPSTEEPIGRVPAGTAADVNAATEAARAGQPGWAALTVWERGARLKALAAGVRARAEEVRAIEAADSGNTIANLGNDLHKASNHFEYFAGLQTEVKGETIAGLSTGMHMTLRVPYGVVGRIVPFNHPFMFATANLAAPLAAGNTVVLKSPETSPLTAGIVAELCAAHLPPGVVNIVHGHGLPVGDAIARHPHIRRIGFTGSIRTGLAIQRAAAETCVKHVSLELGGKNPLIIFPDADPDKAADAAVAGMNFAWAGQSCGSTSRILVHESLAARVTERLLERLAAIRVGDASDPESDMGPLNSAIHRDRVHALVRKGRDEARLRIGGDVPAGAAFQRGYWLAPTLFDEVTPGMAIAREEVFGPVMTVQRWSTPEEMIALANDTPYGLTAAIFTNDITAALTAARAIEAGVTHINGSRMHYVGAPFGGMKDSGLGGEECLAELLSYTEVRALHISL
ncbi:aldehyde dehydrogenase family protein [Polymorphobacter sp.]|uniref:aldehyde dehydrogenase family protein n=1 Tax=Polymorphobacter sp. TaxID=1909290 RepID=UPI003F6FF8E0